MAQPIKSEWNEIAKRLGNMYDAVYLRCDGYLIVARLGRISTNKLAIVVAVNGWSIRGDWFPSLSRDNPREMAEEARRFWMPCKRAKYSGKYKKTLEKIYGKKRAKAEGLYDHYIWPRPYWNSPMSFIRHLVKHNENIEIIDADSYRHEVALVKDAYEAKA